MTHAICLSAKDLIRALTKPFRVRFSRSKCRYLFTSVEACTPTLMCHPLGAFEFCDPFFDIPSTLVEPDPTHVATIRKSLQQRDGEYLAMYVGSFAVYQGIDLLFDAIPRAPARRLLSSFNGNAPQALKPEKQGSKARI